MELPKGYLSYSQMMLWLKNPEKYRAKYYRAEPDFETPEMTFGKHIAKQMELPKDMLDKDPILSQVMRYNRPEHSIEVEIEGVQVLAYLDSFDDDLKAFTELKTGHKRSGGKPPWDKVAVAKHEQLPFYSLLIKEKEGTVMNRCHLIWLETEFQSSGVEFDGYVLEGASSELKLTGHIEVFPRVIQEWERRRMKQLLIKTAHEIESDYKSFKGSK